MALRQVAPRSLVGGGNEQDELHGLGRVGRDGRTLTNTTVAD